MALVTAAWFGTKNVGEIDETWYLFHQRFTRNFYDSRSQKCKKILTTWLNSTYSFYARRSQKRKKTLMTELYFLRFWDIRAQKLYIKRWCNWHQLSILPTFYSQLLRAQIPKAHLWQSFLSMFPSIMRQGWHMLRALKRIGSVFSKEFLL